QSDEHTTRTEFQCCAARQNCSAHHAGRTPYETDIAKGSFVTVAPSRWQQLRDNLRADAPATRGRDVWDIDFKRVEADFAGAVGAIESHQTWLQSQKSHRPVGVHCMAENASTISVQATRNIDCKNRNTGAIAPVHQVRIMAVQRTLQSDTEQPINNELPPSARWYGYMCCPACGMPLFEREMGIGR